MDPHVGERHESYRHASDLEDCSMALGSIDHNGEGLPVCVEPIS